MPDGTKTTAVSGLVSARGLAFDAQGTLYVSQNNGTIVKIVNGAITPFASGFTNQSNLMLAFDKYGYLFVADFAGDAITKIAPDGTKTLFASGIDGPAGLAFDRFGNLFVSVFGPTADGGVIYKYASTGRTTFSPADLVNPKGLAFDASGNLYQANANATIYKYTTSGTRSALPAAILQPTQLAFDSAGNLFVSDGDARIHKVTPSGTRTDFAVVNFPYQLAFEPPLSQPLNISTRVNVQTGDNALIGGFIATGSAPKKLMVRAIGPSLSNFGIPGTLQDTTLEVRAANGSLIASNDNWKINEQTNQSQQAVIQATGLAPSDDRESAVIVDVAPAAFTAIVRGKNNTTGVGLVEIYDLNQTADSRLANISSRALVETGSNVMIGGFIVGSGNGAARVVARAIGPSLTGLGITNALADPTLELRDGNGAIVEVNDDWKLSNHFDAGQEVITAGLAPTNDRESAVLVTLPNGNYTVIVAGYNGATGVGLVEIYNLR
jgi:sugar lactone lactonase YvrE